MDNAALTTDAHVLAVVAGVVFGSTAVSSACWVWLRKQIFAYGGSALCGAGVVLLGLSIWHSVEFGVTGTGLSLKLQAAELEKRLDAVSSELASTQFNSASIEHRLADLTDQNAELKKATTDARAYAELAARAAESSSAIAAATAETGRKIVSLADLRFIPHSDSIADPGTKDAGKAIEKAAQDTWLAIEKAGPVKSKCLALGLAC